MFSSLKLLQCSITLLETMGERGLEEELGLDWARPFLADEATGFVSKCNRAAAADRAVWTKWLAAQEMVPVAMNIT